MAGSTSGIGKVRHHQIKYLRNQPQVCLSANCEHTGAFPAVSNWFLLLTNTEVGSVDSLAITK